jgi:3'(2'), 5'-bisphosphate nucleotidase
MLSPIISGFTALNTEETIKRIKLKYVSRKNKKESHNRKPQQKGTLFMLALTEALMLSLYDIAKKAGEAILTIYQQPGAITVTAKHDESPLTKADLASHQCIVKGLKALTPQLPILSEESVMPAYSERQAWSEYWLIDPLDGTKEFVNRNDEFTVNIALIRHHRAVAGVVYVPVKGYGYYGVAGGGAFKRYDHPEKPHQMPSAISVRALPAQGTSKVIVASRRHGAQALEHLVQRLERAWGQVDKISMGSSLKLCLVAEGQADLYPRLAPTSEWDTAAAHAIVTAAGGRVVNTALEELSYNAKESILNPFFHVLGDPCIDWQSLLLESG